MLSVTVSVHDTEISTFEEFMRNSTVLHGELSLDRAVELVQALLLEFGMELVSAKVLQAASFFEGKEEE